LKLLVGIGEGIGNFIMATPLIEALGRIAVNNTPTDVIFTANYPEAAELLQGWERIGKISPNPNEFDLYSYHRILITPWFGLPQTFFGMGNVMVANGNLLRLTSEVEVNMDLARILGYKGETPPYHVEYNKNRDFSMYKGCVGFHNGANPRWPFKRWPYFPQLAEKFERVVLVGSLQDRQDGWPSNVHNFQGLLPLRDTAALMRACDFFVTNDSGLMHLAVALGVKTYAIFGPTSQKKNLPKGVMPISKGLECQPCQHTNRWGFCNSLECMAGLSPDEVYEQIQNG